jgi:cobalt-zinc-cadmium efflux system outer membrane protein
MYHKRTTLFVLYIFFIGFFGYTSVIFGQSAPVVYDSIARRDTVILTLQDAERIMLDKNLDLIANHFNIDIAHAQTITAKLWDNLGFSYNQNIWNPNTRIPFTIRDGGEVALQLDQVFKIAGQRHRLVQYNKANEKAVAYAYYDLMRNLKFQFRSDFYQLDALLKTQRVYTVELEKSTMLEKALSEAYAKNDVALKDLVTIQSTMFQLQTDLTANLSQITDLEAEMRYMLGLQPRVFVMPSMPPIDNTSLPTIIMDSLYTEAIANRPDVLNNAQQVEASDWYLKYNKSLVAPDLDVSLQYDKAASAFPDYTGFGVSLPLPLWNLNQGGIKSARATLKQNQTQLDASKLKAVNDVNSAYLKLVQLSRINLDVQIRNNQSFDKLMSGIYDVFQKKEMTLRDLVIYMDTYKQQVNNFNNYIAQYYTAKESLNMAVGKDIIK